MRAPHGFLFDYGGTLVEEVGFDARAGVRLLLSEAEARPPGTSLEEIFERADRVSREVAERRDSFQIETPWASLTRLVYDFFGIRFRRPLADLELLFWNASVKTRPMPGALEALTELRGAGIPMGVVSNSSFGQDVIRQELAKHGLAEFLSIMVVSAEYVVRKPNRLLYETAAARLGVACSDVWFVGDRLDTDMRGARAAGMTTVWYRPSSGAHAPEVDIGVSMWADLLKHFREAAHER